VRARLGPCSIIACLTKISSPFLSAYKQSLPPQTDALLAERSRIDSSNRMTDEILEYVVHRFNEWNRCVDFFPDDSQAYATREDFAQQRTMLTGVNSRMTGVLSESCKAVGPVCSMNTDLAHLDRFNARDQLASIHDPV
jgi:hypothetical protein